MAARGWQQPARRAGRWRRRLRPWRSCRPGRPRATPAFATGGPVSLFRPPRRARDDATGRDVDHDRVPSRSRATVTHCRAERRCARCEVPATWRDGSRLAAAAAPAVLALAAPRTSWAPGAWRCRSWPWRSRCSSWCRPCSSPRDAPTTRARCNVRAEQRAGVGAVELLRASSARAGIPSSTTASSPPWTRCRPSTAAAAPCGSTTRTSTGSARPMALMLLPNYTNGCVDSMEGLLFESATSTPYHFINQAELSVGPSEAMVSVHDGDRLRRPSTSPSASSTCSFWG